MDTFRVYGPIILRFLIFTGGSLLGAVFDYAVTVSAARFGVTSPAAALAMAMVISASVTFAYHENITFPGHRKDWIHRYRRFMTLAVIILIFRVIILQSALMIGLNIYLSTAIAIVLASVINFSMSKVIVFTRDEP